MSLIAKAHKLLNPGIPYFLLEVVPDILLAPLMFTWLSGY
jgi:hypothetical protein